MLTVEYSDDPSLLEKLYEKTGINAEVGGINAVLYENENAVGVCRMTLTDGIVDVGDFAVADGTAEKAFAEDFFFRTILFKLSFTPVLVRIDGEDDRLKKFGFAKKNGKSVLKASEAVFPSLCEGNKRKNGI